MEQRIAIGRSDRYWLAMLSPAFWIGSIRQDVSDLLRFRYAFAILVANQLKVRYQRSVLGFLWTLLNPLLMLTVLAVFLSQVLRMQVEHYAVYLFSGLVPWQFFSATLTEGSKSLVTHELLLRKINMPKILFPLADAVVAGLNMLLAMVAMFLLLQVLHPAVHVQLVLVPVGIFLLGCFTFGLTLVMMTLVTYFRDFEHITQVFLQAFYFACPILYMPGHIGKYAWLIEANPMTHVLAFFQAAFYYGEWPDSRTWLLAVLAATVSLGFGGVIYKRYEHDYIHRL